MKKNWFGKISAGFLLTVFCFLLDGLAVYGAEPVVVVLDPGHGGENLGAEYGEYTEKEMTMVVAKAMKEELEKYEGIQVYLTHERDADMSLEERAAFARDKNADFLFCLHFNMSEEHDKFGAEVWVSAFGDKYQKGYTFASVEMDLLVEKGLYSRGIKTRLNDRGEDYYGILRHCTAMDVPAALIEHCHLDQENDQDFYTSEEKMKQFGILDATAVAKYFGLRSETLGVDYGTYKNVEIPEPSVPVKPDTSEPDVCIIEAESVDSRTGEVTIQISAADYDSYLLYYSYSYDGGETFSDLQRWDPRSTDSLTFVMKVPSGTLPEAVVKVYNAYDRITESNHISLPSMRYEEYGEILEAGNMAAQSNAGINGSSGADGISETNGINGIGGINGINGTNGIEESNGINANVSGEKDSSPGTNTAGNGSSIGESAQASGADTGKTGTDGADGSSGMEKGSSTGTYGSSRRTGASGEDARPVTVWYFLQVCLVSAAILFVLLLIARLAVGKKCRGGSAKKSGGKK